MLDLLGLNFVKIVGPAESILQFFTNRNRNGTHLDKTESVRDASVLLVGAFS